MVRTPVLEIGVIKQPDPNFSSQQAVSFCQYFRAYLLSIRLSFHLRSVRDSLVLGGKEAHLDLGF